MHLSQQAPRLSENVSIRRSIHLQQSTWQFPLGKCHDDAEGRRLSTKQLFSDVGTKMNASKVTYTSP